MNKEKNQRTEFIRMENITKTFPGVKALDGVDFLLRSGEIHALLGENGAGKSTLMKILAGMYRATSGSIYVDGQKVIISKPEDAIHHHIGMVYQNFALAPELTVLENIVMGSKIPFLMNTKSLETKVDHILKKYGLKVDLHAKVWQLSVGEQQRVEIVKCFYHDTKVLIMDEPTSVLTPPEIEELFTMMRRVVASGCAVVFISHKLNEVLEIADRITVFRKGLKIGEIDTKNADMSTLSRMMVGRDINLNLEYPRSEPGKEILFINSVYAKNDKRVQALCDVSLQVREGEILGIAAVSGNGQAELAEVITGLRRIDKGSIELNTGEQIHKMSIRQIIDAGISHISEKRLDRSLIPNFSIGQNLIIKDYKNKRYVTHMMLNKKSIRTNAEELIQEYGIAAPGPDTAVRKLSGGNVQKVVLARELTRSPRVILAVNPTYGLDVGAIEFIQSCLIKQREKGAAILLISEELEEVLRLSDRVAVMAKGKIVSIFSRGECNIQHVGLMMTGGKENG